MRAIVLMRSYIYRYGSVGAMRNVSLAKIGRKYGVRAPRWYRLRLVVSCHHRNKYRSPCDARNANAVEVYINAL